MVWVSNEGIPGMVPLKDMCLASLVLLKNFIEECTWSGRIYLVWYH